MARKKGSGMTDADYIESEGLLCPYCESRNVEAGRPDMEGDFIYVPILCHDCDAEYDDVYTLTGYDDGEDH